MEKSIITTGKTIDDAVEAALLQLGLTRDDVSYQVISLPKSGFFGIGAVPAKVQVTYEAPDLKPAPKAEVKAEAAKLAAEKAAAAREYNAKRGVVEEESPKNEALSGIPERPYCKGRAYDPNRYNR